ncbi:hypothetical protein [Microbacterium sp.]|uniref:hypothetical protein n=1 Tax=Microbacterium sp. TaxID=51671 RepID=UPI0039E710F9
MSTPESDDDQQTATPAQPAQNAPTERDAPEEDKAPAGGDETTEDQLDADNAAEEATIAALDPDDSPA